MALSLASPRGLLSDEDECGAAVFESTAADMAGPGRCGTTFPEVSLIFPGPEQQRTVAAESKASSEEDGAGAEKVKVYLRIRPLTPAENEKGEDRGCVCVQDEETLVLRAPKDSFNLKISEKGISQSMHKFTFTQISGPGTSQQEFFERTMKDTVRDVLRGENRLLYTYGVTNSGKTYTIQGTGREAGLLPRALVSMFKKLQGRLYDALDLKPVLCQEVRWLDSNEVRAEEIRRELLLKEDEVVSSQQSRSRAGVSLSCDSGIASMTTASCLATQLEDTDSVCLDSDSLSQSGADDLADGIQFSVWVSFFEIYNEFLYDLLDTPPQLQPRKRATLRLSDDRHGNPYVKDLTWVQVQSAEEAWKVLRAGQRNQTFATTHLNHNSSRSHSIFSIRILHIYPDGDQHKGTRISELSVCDLAGSERCKDQSIGTRMKEANNINTSLHTLGRCLTALRHNQANRTRPPLVVPFRDSKLTRVLQGFFCGRGRSCMVVNINPCGSTYDETLQALKFSAIATQLVHGPSTRTRVAYIQSLLRQHALRATAADTSLGVEEEEDSEDEEGDVTMFDSESLLRAIEVLKAEVLRQRMEKEELEASVREQVCSEMMEVITRMENDFSDTLETERALMEERNEERLNNLKKNLKRYYNEEMEKRDEEIEHLTIALQSSSRDESSSSSIIEEHPTRESVRRSRRLAASRPFSSSSSSLSSSSSSSTCSAMAGELSRVRDELEKCQAELLGRTEELRHYEGLLALPGTTGALTTTVERKLQDAQRNLRQLRLDLQRLGSDLQSAERACCRNTGGEKLRHALSAADDTLAKQDQVLAELQNNLLLVKMDLKKKTESLAELEAGGAQAPPPSPLGPTSSCKKRGCAATTEGDAENRRPEKRALLHTLFSGRAHSPVTPSSRILRSRQRTPPPSPAMQRKNRGFVF